MTFSRKPPTTGPKLPAILKCNQSLTALSLRALCFLFLGRKCDQTCEVHWRMRLFHNKTIAVLCSDGGKPANKNLRGSSIFSKMFFFFSPRHQLLDRIWKILQGWNWNMLIGEWQQLSAGATSHCNCRLFLTTCQHTQNGHSAADCRKHRLSWTDRTFAFLTSNCTEDLKTTFWILK